MARCSKCGKHGLFLKMYQKGVCYDCHVEELRNEIPRIEASIQEVKNKKLEADNELSCYLRKIEEQKQKANNELLEEQKNINQHLLEIDEQRKKADEGICAIQKTLDKYRALAKSVKASINEYNAGTRELSAVEIAELSIDEMLVESPLNCLTVKPLAAKYRALRKDIIAVCKAYESRYTTKTNAAIYKLMVLALESALDNILHDLQYGNLDKSIGDVRTLTTQYYVIAADGNQTIAPTLKKFIAQIESLYIDVVRVEHEYFVQRERAKEEQRALREQMRQEAEERKRLEQERKKVENEEKKYVGEMERISADMQSANDAEKEKLLKRLNELESLMAKVNERKTEIVNLQNGKAGTVYVISNIGSFGDHVFKIGMTRRLEPQERIDELCNASVPFPFDIHSLIFSEDAVALEKHLHDTFNDKRVNKVNLRKEFFDVDIEEIQKEVERVDPTAPFKLTMLAEQYRQSLNIDKVVVATIDGEDDE